jgi:hypothetical protein
MAIANIENNRYSVDSVYQWDINQKLEIRGLSLPSTPEIHFSNSDMTRSIVRRANMDKAGVITVDIPNSLIQKPYKIKAYICIYESETFKSLYCIEIPVKAKNKPGDYTIENDEEIYSFNALESLVNDTVNTLKIENEKTIERVETLEQSDVTMEKKQAELETLCKKQSDAVNISYNNEDSNLESENVNDAINELGGEIYNCNQLIQLLRDTPKESDWENTTSTELTTIETVNNNRRRTMYYGTFYAEANNGYPTELVVQHNNRIVAHTTNQSGPATIPFVLMLDVGDIVEFKAKYSKAGVNKIHIYGVDHSLEDRII